MFDLMISILKHVHCTIYGWIDMDHRFFLEIVADRCVLTVVEVH